MQDLDSLPSEEYEDTTREELDQLKQGIT